MEVSVLINKYYNSNWGDEEIYVWSNAIQSLSGGTFLREIEDNVISLKIDDFLNLESEYSQRHCSVIKRLTKTAF